NLAATIDLLLHRDSILDQWFKDSSLRPHHVTYLHHNSQNELITLLGRAVHQAILNDTHKAQFISVTVDSTTDISNKEIYTIVIRFVKDFITQERIISVMELNSKVGEDICGFVFILLDQRNKPNMRYLNRILMILCSMIAILVAYDATKIFIWQELFF
ncbi:unnamed protein product, partial [Rotaria sordida]